MRFLIVPDSFKGSLTSKEVIEIIAKELKEAFSDCVIDAYPLADGGEGSLEIIVDALGGKYIKEIVEGPLLEETKEEPLVNEAEENEWLFNKVEAAYGILEDGTAVIEMAKASGLTLIPRNQRNAGNTSTFGTGQLINKAIEAGAKDFIIGLGGSATNDAGIGMMSALGAKFYDKDGKIVTPIGKNLNSIQDFDLSHFNEKIRGCNFKVMCDITNPLLGEKGATYTFGPQKGATKEELKILEEGMCHFKNLAYKKLQIDKSNVAGAGAAGGMGYAFCEFFDGKLESGIDTIIKLYDLNKKVKEADIVISGEGHADSQSADGKVLSGIGRLCKGNNKKLIAIVGGMSKGAEMLYNIGINKIYSCVEENVNIEEAMKNAKANLALTTKKVINELLK